MHAGCGGMQVAGKLDRAWWFLCMSLVFPPIQWHVLTRDMILHRLISRDVGLSAWGSTDGMVGNVGWKIVRIAGFAAECLSATQVYNGLPCEDVV